MPNPPALFEKIAFVASEQPVAQEALARLAARYGNVTTTEADVIVALGGDGLMLETLHRFMHAKVPIYGMHRGSVGFLMNDFDENALPDRLANAQITRIRPLKMVVVDEAGDSQERLAINEVSLFRATHQAAKLRISVDGLVRMDELVSDGVLVATPAGSTAYNLSLQGPIIPIEASLLALTPISPFRPRRWRGALLSNKAQVDIEVLEPHKRPVNAAADNDEIRNVIRVHVEESREHELIMLFDPGHSLDERIISEQFIH
jgi:NAD+ kinase